MRSLRRLPEKTGNNCRQLSYKPLHTSLQYEDAEYMYTIEPAETHDCWYVAKTLKSSPFTAFKLNRITGKETAIAELNKFAESRKLFIAVQPLLSRIRSLESIVSEMAKDGSDCIPSLKALAKDYMSKF